MLEAYRHSIVAERAAPWHPAAAPVEAANPGPGRTAAESPAGEELVFGHC